MILVIPAIAGLAWLLPPTLRPEAYANRTFSLEQRLLTEPRILLHYINWTLLPTPQTLGFYHDDIAISTSLLQRPSTLVAIFALLLLFLAAIWQLRARPLFSLGIFWFFCAHVLTATFIPLELVFEHRNYFSALGLLLSVTSFLITPIGHMTILGRTLGVIALPFFAFITYERASDWSHPIRFAYAEAAHHPQSPRATYELGQTLIVASGYRPDSTLIAPAINALVAAGRLPDSSTLAEASLIIVAGHMKLPINPEWWKTIDYKLTERPISEEDISAIASLLRCQDQGACPRQTDNLLEVFLHALHYPSPKPRLLGEYSDFARTQLHDYVLAERVLRSAIDAAPDENDYRISLAQILIEGGHLIDARIELSELHRRSLSPVQQKSLVVLEGLLAAQDHPLKTSLVVQ